MSDNFEPWRTRGITPALIEQRIKQVNAQKKLLLRKFQKCMGKERARDPGCGIWRGEQVKTLQSIFPDLNINPYLYPNRTEQNSYFHRNFYPKVLEAKKSHHPTRATSFKNF